jgi:bifunctional non-homologous end joining protein LigD
VIRLSGAFSSIMRSNDGYRLRLERDGDRVRLITKGGKVDRKGVATMLVRALAIVFAVAGAICFLWPGAIGGLLFHALPVSARESVIIGALFFVGAAILLFLGPSNDKRPWDTKRRDRPYQAGRSKHWVKIKNRQHPAMSRVMEAFGWPVRQKITRTAGAPLRAMRAASPGTMQMKPRARRQLRRPGDLSAHPAMRKHMAAQRRAIKLTPFPKFIDRESGTRSLAALVAAVKHCCSPCALWFALSATRGERIFKLDAAK